MFGKATTNSELDQSLLLVHLHFFHSSFLPKHISSFTCIHKQCHPHFQDQQSSVKFFKKVGSVANNLGNNLDLPVPFDNQVDLFVPFDNQVD